MLVFENWNIYFSIVEFNELPCTVTVSTQGPIKSGKHTTHHFSLPSFWVSPAPRLVRCGEGNGLIHFLLPINCRLSMSDRNLVYVQWEIRFFPLPWKGRTQLHSATSLHLLTFPPHYYHCNPYSLFSPSHHEGGLMPIRSRKTNRISSGEVK